MYVERVALRGRFYTFQFYFRTNWFVYKSDLLIHFDCVNGYFNKNMDKKQK